VNALNDRQPRLLHNFFRGGRIADPHSRQADQGGVMPLNERFERAFFTSPQSSDKGWLDIGRWTLGPRACESRIASGHDDANLSLREEERNLRTVPLLSEASHKVL